MQGLLCCEALGSGEGSSDTAWGLGFRVKDLRLRIWNLGFRV